MTSQTGCETPVAIAGLTPGLFNPRVSGDWGRVGLHCPMPMPTAR
jgi:hypothetical protein